MREGKINLFVRHSVFFSEKPVESTPYCGAMLSKLLLKKAFFVILGASIKELWKSRKMQRFRRKKEWDLKNSERKC